MGFGVQGLGFRVWGLRFRVQGVEPRTQTLCPKPLKVSGRGFLNLSGLQAQACKVLSSSKLSTLAGFKSQGLGFRVSGLRFRQGLGFRGLASFTFLGADAGAGRQGPWRQKPG